MSVLRARVGQQVDPPLYTTEQKESRDKSPWTLIQGILAPVQFVIFIVSLVLVLRFVFTGQDYALTTLSVVVKTAALYLIMVTGAIWERDVFGQYLFAPAFYWEDVVSMLVLALHTAYLVVVINNLLSPMGQMMIALAAYTAYLINAAQFVLKLRRARLQGRVVSQPSSAGVEQNIGQPGLELVK